MSNVDFYLGFNSVCQVRNFSLLSCFLRRNELVKDLGHSHRIFVSLVVNKRAVDVEIIGDFGKHASLERINRLFLILFPLVQNSTKRQRESDINIKEEL